MHELLVEFGHLLCDPLCWASNRIDSHNQAETLCWAKKGKRKDQSGKEGRKEEKDLRKISLLSKNRKEKEKETLDSYKWGRLSRLYYPT